MSDLRPKREDLFSTVVGVSGSLGNGWMV